MKKKKGISLIVLVITIIVMVILASSIILTLSNSGIINRANEAVEKTDLAQVKHLAALKWSEAYLRNEKDIPGYVIDKLAEEGVTTDKYDITVTLNGVDVELKEEIPSEWTENVVALKDGVPIPKGFVASRASGENSKSSGLVIYEGTEIVTNDNVENARRTRNQYVWVPVSSEDFTTKFIRQNFGMNRTISNTLGTQYWEVALDLTTNIPKVSQNSNYVTNVTVEGRITNTLAEVQAMYASVKEYEGFYIARYEAGIDTQRTYNNNILESNVYSMMGKIPYTYIPWTMNNKISEDTKGAVEVARSIYPITDTNYGVVSTLTYGVQWDAVLQWWMDTNGVTDTTLGIATGNYKDYVIKLASDLNDGALVWDYTTSSTGAYVPKHDNSLAYPKASGTSWSLSTGALKAASVNNIYDMAGNMEEWTMEGYATYDRIRRGGYFNSDTGSCPGANRYYGGDLMGPSMADYSTGFRTALYIKK